MPSVRRRSERAFLYIYHRAGCGSTLTFRAWGAVWSLAHYRLNDAAADAADGKMQILRGCQDATTGHPQREASSHCRVSDASLDSFPPFSLLVPHSDCSRLSFFHSGSWNKLIFQSLLVCQRIAVLPMGYRYGISADWLSTIVLANGR